MFFAACATPTLTPQQLAYLAKKLPGEPLEENREPACRARKLDFDAVSGELPPSRDASTRKANPLPDASAGCDVPRALRIVDAESETKLTVEVAADGNVRCARVSKTSGSVEVDAVAVNCASKVKYDPARVDGVAVDSIVETPVKFHFTAAQP
jgi:TonB family protein